MFDNKRLQVSAFQFHLYSPSVSVLSLSMLQIYLLLNSLYHNLSSEANIRSAIQVLTAFCGNKFQCRLHKISQISRLKPCTTLLKLRKFCEGVFSRTQNHQTGAPPTVGGCSLLLYHYFRSYQPYLKIFSSSHNLRIPHAIMIRVVELNNRKIKDLSLLFGKKNTFSVTTTLICISVACRLYSIGISQTYQQEF